MKLAVVAIWDSAMRAFNRPYYVPATGLAVRQFGDEVNRQGDERQPNELNKHPEDFELHQLANWDEDTGTFENLQPTVCLARGKDYRTN